MSWRSALAIVALLLEGSGLPHAKGLDVAAVNAAARPVKVAGSNHLDPGVLKAQILLDRAGFSPGEIDGRLDENTQRAIAAFESSRGISVD
jgi:peptidoglycan hydrolase-like protein with peptidoglycan-binding domain